MQCWTIFHFEGDVGDLTDRRPAQLLLDQQDLGDTRTDFGVPVVGVEEQTKPIEASHRKEEHPAIIIPSEDEGKTPRPDSIIITSQDSEEKRGLLLPVEGVWRSPKSRCCLDHVWSLAFALLRLRLESSLSFALLRLPVGLESDACC